MERRRAPRVPLSVEVTYESGEEFISSYLFDVSGGGVFIRTDNPLESGRPVRVCFHVPAMSNSITAKGTVIWSQNARASSKPGMGVRFDEMDPGDRRRLDDFLKGHEED